jgi:hypothetical protein
MKRNHEAKSNKPKIIVKDAPKRVAQNPPRLSLKKKRGEGGNPNAKINTAKPMLTEPEPSHLFLAVSAIADEKAKL